MNTERFLKTLGEILSEKYGARVTVTLREKTDKEKAYER